MSPVPFGVGCLMILYGLVNLVVRFLRPQWFGKLQAMQRMWGKRIGYTVHFVSYTVSPIALGTILVLMAMLRRR